VCLFIDNTVGITKDRVWKVVIVEDKIKSLHYNFTWLPGWNAALGDFIEPYRRYIFYGFHVFLNRFDAEEEKKVHWDMILGFLNSLLI